MLLQMKAVVRLMYLIQPYTFRLNSPSSLETKWGKEMNFGNKVQVQVECCSMQIGRTMSLEKIPERAVEMRSIEFRENGIIPGREQLFIIVIREK